MWFRSPFFFVSLHSFLPVNAFMRLKWHRHRFTVETVHMLIWVTHRMFIICLFVGEHSPLPTELMIVSLRNVGGMICLCTCVCWAFRITAIIIICQFLRGYVGLWRQLGLGRRHKLTSISIQIQGKPFGSTTAMWGFLCTLLTQWDAHERSWGLGDKWLPSDLDTFRCTIHQAFQNKEFTDKDWWISKHGLGLSPV